MEFVESQSSPSFPASVSIDSVFSSPTEEWISWNTNCLLSLHFVGRWWLLLKMFPTRCIVNPL